jgi:hypothetical protein
MKKSFHFFWVLFSFLAHAGKELPKEISLNQEPGVLQSPVSRQEKEEENLREKATREKKEDAEKKQENAPHVTSLSLPEKLTLNQQSGVLQNLPIASVPRDCVVTDLKKRCANGEVDLFIDPLGSETHLYYPDQFTEDLFAEVFALNGDRKSEADPLILPLSEELITKLDRFFPDWKKIVKTKNIPVIATDWRLLNDENLASQIIRILIDVNHMHSLDWDQVLTAVKERNFQLTIAWAEEKNENADANENLGENEYLSENEDENASENANTNVNANTNINANVNDSTLIMEKLKLLFETGRVSELACGGKAFTFNQKNWNYLMEMGGDQVRSFFYNMSDLENVHSAPVFLKCLSEKMPSLRKLAVFQPFQKYLPDDQCLIGDVYFQHLQDLRVSMPHLESQTAGFLSLFPRHVRYLGFDQNLGHSNILSMPQMYFISKYFYDLHSLEYIDLDVLGCVSVFCADIMDELAKHRNLQKFQINAPQPSGLDSLAEKILLFPRLKKFGLKVKINPLAFLQADSVKKLMKSFDLLDSLETVAFSFPNRSFQPEFVLPTLALLPERLFLELPDVTQNATPEMHSENAEILQQVVEGNPSALTRIRVGPFVDLASYLKQYL